jgi:hypothetical protein
MWFGWFATFISKVEEMSVKCTYLFNLDDGAGRFLCIASIYPPNYTAWYLRQL